VELPDQAAQLRRVELAQALRAEQAEQDGEVAAVDLQAARREPPLVLERAEVVADRGLVRVRGAALYSRAASAAAVSSPMRRR
jgi:hypothetical protein